jgi:hypothetical protein
MGQTMSMGQAAGSAAALAVQNDSLPHELAVRKLQEHLLQIGAIFGEIRADQAKTEGNQ